MGRPGKIGSLPFAIREEICHQLLNGRSGRAIIADLNQRPEVRAVLEAKFGGAPITDQNFADWRANEYERWLQRREQIELTRERAKFAAELARSGASLSDGAAAILGGELLEAIEALASSDAEERREAMPKLAAVLTKLRAGDHSAERLRQDRERLAQAERELQLLREKFEFLKARAAQADKTEMVVNDVTLTPEERARRIQEIYGRA